MLKIALCDDELKILEEVSLYIKKYAEMKANLNFEISCFDSVKTLENTLECGNAFDIFIRIGKFYYGTVPLNICNFHKHTPLSDIEL